MLPDARLNYAIIADACRHRRQTERRNIFHPPYDMPTPPAAHGYETL